MAPLEDSWGFCDATGGPGYRYGYRNFFRYGTGFGCAICTSVFRAGLWLGRNYLLVAAAATIGDTSFHVSDITLAPTSGLNVDGQHDYIWDTCVIPLIALDIPMFILACLCPLFF